MRVKRPHVGSVRHRCSQAHTSPPSQAVSLGSFWGQRRAEPTGRDRSGVVAGVRLTGPPASLPLHDLLRRSAPRGQILHPVCPSLARVPRAAPGVTVAWRWLPVQLWLRGRQRPWHQCKRVRQKTGRKTVIPKTRDSFSPGAPWSDCWFWY